MKIFIILAMVLNVLLMTHSSDDNDKIRQVEEFVKKQVEEFVKKQASHEKYKVKDNEARMVPLFTTFDYKEPKGKEKHMLIELKEEQAINLYLISKFFQNMVDMSPVQIDDDGYCEATYGNNYSDDKMHELRVNACKAIRSIDFSLNFLLITKVHSSHMNMIMKFVNIKNGILPPANYMEFLETIWEEQLAEEAEKAKKPRKNKKKNRKNRNVVSDPFDDVLQQFGKSYKKLTPEKDDVVLNLFPDDCVYKACKVDMKLVNEIWANNKNDIAYVAEAAMYLEIDFLSQLMGFRIGKEIMLSEDMGLLAEITLDFNEFLKN